MYPRDAYNSSFFCNTTKSTMAILLVIIILGIYLEILILGMHFEIDIHFDIKTKVYAF